jgi:aryl-alcohol dehydrogenase-like predicted oxidoreductase
MHPSRQTIPQGPRARARRHDWIDERSLALARRVAEHAKHDRSVFTRALLWVRQQLTSPAAERNPALREWERILTTATPEEILATLVEDSEHGARLRQSSPFVGVLSREERNTIFAYFETL